MSHYTRQLTITAASIAVAGKLIYNETKPIAIELWQFYTSEKMKRVYEFIILSLVAIAWMGMYAAVKSGNLARQQCDRFIAWRDTFVKSHLQTEITVDPKVLAPLQQVKPNAKPSRSANSATAKRSARSLQTSTKGNGQPKPNARPRSGNLLPA